MSRYDSDGNTRPAEGVRVQAMVKWFNPDKGFGFVAPVDGTPDAFLHVSVLRSAGLGDLREGAEILCEVGSGAKGPQVLRVVEALSLGESAPADADAETVEGTVKWFKPDKGFGFVTADDGGKDVFVHKSVLRRCGLSDLEAGQRVEMAVGAVPKGREATWIGMI